MVANLSDFVINKLGITSGTASCMVSGKLVKQCLIVSFSSKNANEYMLDSINFKNARYRLQVMFLEGLFRVTKLQLITVTRLQLYSVTFTLANEPSEEGLCVIFSTESTIFTDGPSVSVLFIIILTL